MKQIKITIILIAVLISANINAQENAIKVGLTDALTGNFNLSYEKLISEKSSVLIKVGYWKPTVSPFISEGTITPEAFTIQESMGGINASMEYRFYTNNSEKLNGLYIAPYLRYINQSAVYTDEIDNDLFDVDVKLNTIGIGAQIGYQLIINEVLSMDFYFFGAGVDNHRLDVEYQLQTPRTGFDYNTVTDDVSDVFKDINYLEKRLKHEVKQDKLKSKLPFLFPGFRLGISVGIAF